MSIVALWVVTPCSLIQNLKSLFHKDNYLKTVPWMRWLVAGFSPRRPGFALRAVHVGCEWAKWYWNRLFFRVLRFSFVSISPLLHIHSCIIWRMENGPVSGRSSTETQSHPIVTIIVTRRYEKIWKRFQTLCP
jgi:hypothetical protein